ncbi:MAG: 50S ribosomal protein L35 [Candidatus Kerfeldbacteria bacterium]|nr:50S ribosomal protein L35 [Candidatus Kerfeldbacteria bacterium]
MPKLKTHQATAKRVRFTGRSRLLKRKAGQDHFNARESGVTTMRKRRDVSLHPADAKAARRLAPYR